jgi:rSAM/selenodomain-associated transferase 1
MKRRHNHALILFARDPVIGKVKTRLKPHLEDQTILGLYKSFLDDSVEKIARVAGVDRFCWVYPNNASGYFERMARKHAMVVCAQEGQDLGSRMQNALAKCFAEGYEKAVIIGSDSPSLPVAYIEQAFASEKDVMIGPSTDAGYYLIGANRKVPDVFADVAWGTDRVLSETLALIWRSGASLETLPVWYDVDRYEDVLFLKTHLGLLDICGMNESPATRDFLRQLDL